MAIGTHSRENCQSACDHLYIVADYLTSELASKCVAGLFEDNLPGVLTSRFDVQVILKSNKPWHWHLIVDLSAVSTTASALFTRAWPTFLSMMLHKWYYSLGQAQRWPRLASQVPSVSFQCTQMTATSWARGGTIRCTSISNFPLACIRCQSCSMHMQKHWSGSSEPPVSHILRYLDDFLCPGCTWLRHVQSCPGQHGLNLQVSKSLSNRQLDCRAYHITCVFGHSWLKHQGITTTRSNALDHCSN